MNNSLQDLNHLSRKYHAKIQKLTASLYQQFRITYFTKQVVTNDGYWEMLGSQPTWLEFSAENQFYLHDPSLVHPDHYQSGIIYATAHDNPEFQETLCKVAIEKFDINHCLCISQKTLKGCEFYFFATESANTKILNTYINQIPALKRYIQYFNQEASAIVSKMEDYSINIANIKKEAFYANDNLLDLSAFQEPHLQKISPKEKTCLHYLLKGKTAKETAIILNLSFRTVEEHIDNLKSKLHCQKKRDLFLLFPQGLDNP